MDALYPCFCLTALARTSSTVLESRGERGHSCSVPDLNGEASNLSPLNFILAIEFL